MRKAIMVFLLAAVCAASAPALDIGDTAPEISPLVWVSGEPADPTKPDDNTLYIVEVWSTTCPPCTASIPILNDINKRYAGKVKIVSFTADTEDMVRPYLEEHPIEYSSFIDKEGASTVNYMAADNRNTIPHAFLFDKSGRLVWIGNPLDNLEKRINSVLDGTFTLEKALAVREAEDALQTAINGQNVAQMLAGIEKLQELEPSNGKYYLFHYQLLTQLGIGDRDSFGKLLDAWFKGCGQSVEDLVAISMLATEKGHPLYRNPRLALTAARRAYELADDDTKAEAGINLAEVYKFVGLVGRSVDVVEEIEKKASPEQKEALEHFKKYYMDLKDLASDPDKDYKL